MKTLINYIEEAFRVNQDNKPEQDNAIINSIDDFAKELKSEFGIKAKQFKGYGSTKEFGNWGDYGAKTYAKNCYEMDVPMDWLTKPRPVKIQFGVVDGVSKDWMKKQIKEGELIFRTCKKEKTLSGKETFKWMNNALDSLPFGQPFETYIEYINNKVNGPNS